MIKFGTDGWRAVIGEEFTYDNVRRVALAHAKVLKKRGLNRVFVGYDRRFSSENFALEAYKVFKSMGFEVKISDRAITTPQVSYAVRYLGFDNGVMITASHNPPIYNGYKVKDTFGGSATPSLIGEIEEHIGELPEVENLSVEEEKLGVSERYVSYLRDSVNLGIFNEKSLRVVHDPMHGTSAGLLHSALEGTRQEIIQIRGYRDTLFGGNAPEPVEKNLGVLMDKVRSVDADLGIANDGDGDRIALVDEKGEFVNTQLIYVLLLLHLLRNKGKREGKVVKTVSTSFLVDRICRQEGVELEEVAVGFKNINEVILREKVIFGGEESGGYGFPELLPERDGLLSALMIMEFMLLSEKRLSELIEWVFETYGRAYYKRVDLRVDEGKKAKLKELVNNPPERFAGQSVSRAVTVDGLKLVFSDDSWLLLRASGTEPLIRIYAEAPEERKTERLIEEAREIFS